MKIALACDSLIERDDSTEILDLFCEIFPEAPLFTFAHKIGGVLGPVEQRRVSSSYLSRWVTTQRKWKKWKFLAPTLGKSFFIPREFDLVVGLSTGLIHGLTHAPSTKFLCYLYSLDFYKQQMTGLGGKFFSAYLKDWQLKSLSHVDYIFTSSSHLGSQVESYLLQTGLQTGKKSHVLPPAFHYREFPLITLDEEKNLDSYLVNVEGLTKGEIEILGQYFKQKMILVRFVGVPQNEKVKKVLTQYGEFWGERCAGDLSLILRKAKVVLDLSPTPFPFLALKALASGRPVIVRDQISNQEYLPKVGSYFWDGGSLKKNFSLFQELLSVVETEYSWFKTKELRHHALKFHDMGFRQEIKQAFESLLP